MTPETRRRIFQYGIAVDLVILASGVGLLYPTAAMALVVTYVAAVALSAWKSGWEGAATAIVLSIILLPLFFSPAFGASHLLAFAAASVTAAAIVRAGLTTRVRRYAPATIDSMSVPHVIAFERLGEEIEPEQLEDEGVARQQEIVAKTIEHRGAQQLDEFRRAAIERERARADEESRLAIEEARQRTLAEEQRRADEEARQREVERQAAVESARRMIEDERPVANVEAPDPAPAADPVPPARPAKKASVSKKKRAEAERLAAAEAEAEVQRVEQERRRVEEEAQQRLEAERLAAEAAAQQLIEQERRRVEEEAKLRLEEERRAAEAAAQQLIDEQRRAAEEELRQRVESERAAIRARLEEQLETERRAMEKEAEEQLAAARARAKEQAPKEAKPAAAASHILESITGTVSSWLHRAPRSGVNLSTKTIATNRAPAPRRQLMSPPRSTSARKPASTAARHPRLLMLERRRGTADTAAPKLRQKGIEVVIVERWVDAVDELFRFRPDLIAIDTDLPDFEKIHHTVSEQNAKLPIVLTGRANSSAPGVRHAAFLTRPFEAAELADLTAKAMTSPEDLAVRTLISQHTTPSKPAAPARPVAIPVAAVSAPAPAAVKEPEAPPQQRARERDLPIVKLVSEDAYEVTCFNCRVAFEALDADWCSCLTKERTLVCTNCLSCFCKAPPSYKEQFWVAAPQRLFERKTGEARRQQSGLPVNVAPEAVTRPLVLTVEDDEEIQAIVARVCSNLGYGFVYATNGQDGLELARQYRPNLILSDAFMPKLDGREMCRMLREESPSADWKMVVMTGLYTDTKYRSEAVKRFHVDDYIAKPVAVTDLITLLQKHLEGINGTPLQEDLHELHRQDVDEMTDEVETDGIETDGIALADLMIEEEQQQQQFLSEPETPAIPIAKPRPKEKSDAYEVCCFNCNNTFDATKTEWCTCVGRDQTLRCTHCDGCFCKAPAAYKERFWMDAPPSLFERKMIGSKRHLGARSNPAPDEVKRPLILLVEDDENVQLIVRTVVTSMGYGFIAGANGQEGLALAREYNPDLILSDAFMPKLDGREMCRLLKEDPLTARVKAIIMTGLYTDRKYRNEALDYFKVDDYVAKPLAVNDLIKLFKKHLPQEMQAMM